MTMNAVDMIIYGILLSFIDMVRDFGWSEVTLGQHLQLARYCSTIRAVRTVSHIHVVGDAAMYNCGPRSLSIVCKNALKSPCLSGLKFCDVSTASEFAPAV